LLPKTPKPRSELIINHFCYSRSLRLLTAFGSGETCSFYFLMSFFFSSLNCILVSGIESLAGEASLALLC